MEKTRIFRTHNKGREIRSAKTDNGVKNTREEKIGRKTMTWL